MAIERLQRDFSIDQESLKLLEQVVPEAFADGKINWETLKEALGEYLEDDSPGAEHFGLTWHGKREARRLASLPSQGTLVPVPGEGVSEDNTSNIFIEGDNLEVLKLLQKSYAGQIKLIYIDPPYNTGQDFIYKDNFSEPIESYLKKTSQMDEEGEILTTNPKSGGRFHSNWLSFIYPRILLARHLLCSDGVLWISIDDGEFQHLRLICDDIFGEENFVASFIWEKRTTRENRRVFSFNHDYIICYAKDKDEFQTSRNFLPLTEEVLNRYSNPDNDPRGKWQSVSLAAQAGHATPSQFYTISTPSGRNLDPPPGSCWRVTKKKLQELIDENRIWFGERGNNVPRRKIFLSEARDGLTPHTLWKADEVGTNDSAKKALIELFNGESVFDTPKPIELIKRIIHISTNSGDIVLDFFAGSCTTAQATMELNRDDGGCRKCILVQIEEPSRNKYSTISEIGKERWRLASSKLNNEESEKLNLHRNNADRGFRVLKLRGSNFKIWKNYEGDDVHELQTTFLNFEDSLIQDWQELDVVTEVLLIEGFPLDSRVNHQAQFGNNRVLMAESDFVAHKLFICLDSKITDETIRQLPLPQSEDVFICLDSALTDEAKLQLADTCNIKTI